MPRHARKSRRRTRGVVARGGCAGAPAPAARRRMRSQRRPPSGARARRPRCRSRHTGARRRAVCCVVAQTLGVGCWCEIDISEKGARAPRRFPAGLPLSQPSDPRDRGAGPEVANRIHEPQPRECAGGGCVRTRGQHPAASSSVRKMASRPFRTRNSPCSRTRLPLLTPRSSHGISQQSSAPARSLGGFTPSSAAPSRSSPGQPVREPPGWPAMRREKTG